MGGTVTVLAVLGLAPPFPRIVRRLGVAVAAAAVAVEAFTRGEEVVVVAVALVAAIHLKQPLTNFSLLFLARKTNSGGLTTPSSSWNTLPASQ